MTELYRLPRGAPLRVRIKGTLVNAVFHHIDGMYSYCTLEGSGEVFHLKAWTPMAKIGERWEVCG